MGFEIWDPRSGIQRKPIPDPGSRGLKGTGSRIRNTGEGWLNLTVETEVNGDLRSTKERGPSLVGWAHCASTSDFCPAFVSVGSLVQNMFFLIEHYFSSIAQLLAGQAVVLGHMSPVKSFIFGFVRVTRPKFRLYW
jgi:hypothetical protein